MATLAAAPAALRPVTCSPRTPWGIHSALVRETCPRCGWARAEVERAR
ncbi:hypothetical protein [Sphingomonas parva]|nr:hypothetical protein [Sphingomonas parva]